MIQTILSLVLAPPAAGLRRLYAVGVRSEYFNLPRVVYLLCLGTLINRAGTLLIPFLTIYMKNELNGGVHFATLAMGALGMGSMLGQTVGGHLADRIGRRAVMIFALFGGAAFMVLLTTVSDARFFLAGTFALASVSEMLRPAVQAMMADVVPPAQRPYSFSLMYVSINLGFAIGPTLGGLLAEAYSFRSLFLADAATSMAYGLIVLVAIAETRPKRSAPADQSAQPRRDDSLAAALGTIARDRLFIGICAATFLLSLVYMQSMSTFPLYLEELGYRPSTYGAIIAVNGWLIVAIQIPATKLIARFHRGHILVLSALLTSLGFGLHGLAGGPWQFVAAVAIWTLGEICHAPVIGPLVADLAPEQLRGRYMGVFGMCFSGANMLGAPLGGLVLAEWGAASLWLLAAALPIVGAIIYYQVGQHLPASAIKPPEPAPT